ncbi:hypothetical protein [Dactylosporangium sp. CA-139066]|uniref:hypothetical protein n=1 Tax=Dactylosporangium sp. CA-139066 TaxID=3239930 RepID=UPI003D8D78C7
MSHNPLRRLFASAGPAPAEPSAADPRRDVELWIERLAAGGSVDEGNARVLDRMIDAWREQQLQRIDAYYIDRRRAHEAALLDLQDRLRAAELRQERAAWVIDRYAAVSGAEEGAEAGPAAADEPAGSTGIAEPVTGRRPGRRRAPRSGPFRAAGPGWDGTGRVAS